ncbi:histidinol-phosphatase [Sphingomonas sp. 1P06PA]|uniref:histidinol-phosphatase n=1 Tax=Sphingomonas sp. 1P06PA TaxID=554121 RepID=UPI0039A48DBA
MTEDDIALAEMLADAAGDAIRPLFRRAYQTEAKADRSPVTEADRAAEAAMRRILDVKRPRDGIIGEEYGRVREEAERHWVLDPIDGTRSFIAGRPIFGTLIALIEAGTPVLGIIDQPITGERWVGARGQLTRLGDRPAGTRRCFALGDALIATTGIDYFIGDERDRYLALAAQARDALYAGDCYNYGLLASGHIDLVVEAGLKLHDFAALVPIVEGAGGGMCDWQGNALGAHSDGHVVAVGDVRLLEAVLERLR